MRPDRCRLSWLLGMLISACGNHLEDRTTAPVLPATTLEVVATSTTRLVTSPSLAPGASSSPSSPTGTHPSPSTAMVTTVRPRRGRW